MKDMKDINNAAAEAANIYIATYTPYDNEPSIDEVKEAYSDGFIQASLMASTTAAAEIERLREEVKRLRKYMRTFETVCEDQEQNWRSIEDYDNACFWHELKNDIGRNIYPNPPRAQKEDDDKCK